MEIQKAAVERGEGFCLGRRVMESRGKRNRVTVEVAKDVLVVHPVVPSAWEPTYQFHSHSMETFYLSGLCP